MEVHGYTETGSIEVTVDGDLLIVPDDATNRHRQMLAEWEAAGNVIPPYVPPAPTEVDINSERSRRILAGKDIGGIYVTGRDEDQRNLTNLALAAQVRLAGGDTSTITVYRDGNNLDHELTPPQMLALWQAASTYVSDLYAASWALKAETPIPTDYADDQHWPAA